MRKILLIILPLFLFFACENKPEGIISKGKMEDVLYDYHLVQGMLNYMTPMERDEKSQYYLDAVFEKHNITQAQFDSSLVWYNKNTEDLRDIYKELKTRYDDLNKELQLQNGNNDMMAVFSTGGDTTNIWGSKNIMVLRNSDLLNKESFSIKSDTSFHRGDTYVLMCKSNVILENKNERKEFIYIGLNVTYKNGKTIGTTRQTTSSSNQQIQLTTNDTTDIDKVSGFFYFKGNPTYRSLAIIDNIQLIRMHKHKTPEDSTSTVITKVEEAEVLTTEKFEDESYEIINDTLIAKPHLSPAEIRAKSSNSDKKIKIKKAPDVRTPNRYGVRKASVKQQQPLKH